MKQSKSDKEQEGDVWSRLHTLGRSTNVVLVVKPKKKKTPQR